MDLTTDRGEVEKPALQVDEEQIRQTMDRVAERTLRMDYSWDWPAASGRGAIPGRR